MKTNDMTIFESETFGRIRTIQDENGEPLFCLRDLCKPLGLHTFAVIQRLPKDIVSKYTLQTAGGRQLMSFVNEEGLYEVVLESRKPEAKAFRRWVTGEVLPSIRKYGAYVTNAKMRELIDHPEAVERLVEDLRNTKVELALAEERATYTELVLDCEDLVTVNQIAQDYGMTAIRFNQLLHKLHIQFCVNGQWILYAEHKDKGYTQSYTHYVGYHRCKLFTKWTQEGRLFLYRTLKDVGIVPLMEMAA